ncbi:AI-2E family transporter [Skermanella sp. TT6]|uniref:AI-2E family transporter n=1 Tax=Skermanella cutis TaxID=2775420 RepID=A0ABX7B0X0_9PROT|nr:AI-2E family transporter [Skermanella sp. TT6]QQP87757.1 AI-2E family transporter [Skermanella sp. TT6]
MPFDSALTTGRFARLLLVAVLIAGLVLMAWQIVDVLLLVFGAILLAVMLRRTADWLAAHTPLSGGWALAVVLLAIVIALGICGWLFGAQVSSQVEELTKVVPEAWGRVREQLEGSSWGRAALDAVSGVDPASVSGGMVREAGSLLMTVVGGLGNVLLLVAGGVYLAAQPGLYRQGVVALVPKSAEARTRQVLDGMGEALGKWLKGQFIAMLMVGALTSLGLWLLGVPSALALGLLAGLGEFVPLIGAFATAIPALLAASTVDMSTVLYTLALYVVIQQIEGNLIMPIVERRMVSLPPALALFAVVAFGLMFGILGVIFATPLTVVAYVAVQKLYVEDALGKREPAS